MSEWYDDNHPRVLTAQQKAIKDYNEAGYAVDDDGGVALMLLEALAAILAYEDGGLTLDPDSYGAEVYANARAAVERAKAKS